jgi:hypothetical protein
MSDVNQKVGFGTLPPDWQPLAAELGEKPGPAPETGTCEHGVFLNEPCDECDAANPPPVPPSVDRPWEKFVRPTPEQRLAEDAISPHVGEQRGRKFDGEKARMDLLHPAFLVDVSKVLTFGARKYAPDNWKKVRHGRLRYFGAILRHLYAWKTGETNDPETGLPHLAHAACCLMFLTGYEAEGVVEAETPCGDEAGCRFCYPR